MEREPQTKGDRDKESGTNLDNDRGRECWLEPCPPEEDAALKNKENR